MFVSSIYSPSLFRSWFERVKLNFDRQTSNGYCELNFTKVMLLVVSKVILLFLASNNFLVIVIFYNYEKQMYKKNKVKST